jgi:hypothetical protein
MKPSEQASKWADRCKVVHTYNLMKGKSFAKWAWLAGYRAGRKARILVILYKDGVEVRKREDAAYQRGIEEGRFREYSDSRQEPKADCYSSGKRTPACPKNINSKSTLNKKLKERSVSGNEHLFGQRARAFQHKTIPTLKQRSLHESRGTV